MIPLIQRETVNNKKWISDKDILDIVAIAESTPGPIAINAATFIGYRVGGFLGAMAATVGVVLPSCVIILIVAKCYERFKSNKLVVGAMNGLKPAVVGLIAAALLSLSGTVFFPQGLSANVFGAAQFYVSLGIFAVAVVLAFKKLHPILIILLSAVIGVIAGVIGTG